MFSDSLHNENLRIRPKVKASFKEILRPYKALTKRSESVALYMAEKVGKFAVLTVSQRFIRFHKVYTGFGDFAGTKSPYCEPVSRLRSLAKEAKTCFCLPEKAIAFELVARPAFSCDAGRIECGRKSLEAATPTQKACDKSLCELPWQLLAIARLMRWKGRFIIWGCIRGGIPFHACSPLWIKELKIYLKLWAI